MRERKACTRTAVGIRLAAATLALAALTTLARADGALLQMITAADKAKLVRHAAVREQALRDARLNGAPADLAQLERALEGEATALAGVDLTGEWQCRVFKLGGAAGLVAYRWFRCRISDDGSGLRLQKLGGSQRTAGRFYDLGGERMAYLGTMHYAGTRAPAYGSDPTRDQVAVAVVPGKDRLRIEFPLPAFESAFDIMELQRIAGS